MTVTLDSPAAVEDSSEGSTATIVVVGLTAGSLSVADSLLIVEAKDSSPAAELSPEDASDVGAAASEVDASETTLVLGSSKTTDVVAGTLVDSSAVAEGSLAAEEVTSISEEVVGPLSAAEDSTEESTAALEVVVTPAVSETSVVVGSLEGSPAVADDSLTAEEVGSSASVAVDWLSAVVVAPPAGSTTVAEESLSVAIVGSASSVAVD